MNRVKYKTTVGENVMTSSQLKTQGGYPVIGFGGKNWQCHIVSFMTFFPDQYAAKTDDHIVLHIKDDKLDFRPSQLRLGTRSQNATDAYDNGKYDGKKTARKPCVSYIDGVFEKEHESLSSGVKYLQQNGYPLARISAVCLAIREGVIRYDRTWK